MRKFFVTLLLLNFGFGAVFSPPIEAKRKTSKIKKKKRQKPKPKPVEEDEDDDEEDGDTKTKAEAKTPKPIENKNPPDAPPDIKGAEKAPPETKPLGSEVTPPPVIDPNRKTAKRRVLILPLENVTQSKDHDWMRESLADNLKTQLIKTKKFDVLDAKTAKVLFPDIKTDNLTQADAATLAKRLNCEVVTLGRFTVRDKMFRLEMEGADALTGTAIGAEKADGLTDGTMFVTIDKVVETLAAELTAKLPVLYADELKRDDSVEKILTQSPDSTEKSGTAKLTEPVEKYRANLLFTAGMPVSAIADHVGMGFGGRASLSRTTDFKWLTPLVMADVYAAGAKATDSMFFYFGGAGLTYGFDLPWKLRLYPHAAFGLSGGSLSTPAGSSSFMLPALDAGGTVEWAIAGPWRLAAAVSYRHIFDPFVTGAFVQAHIGVGYGF